MKISQMLVIHPIPSGDGAVRTNFMAKEFDMVYDTKTCLVNVINLKNLKEFSVPRENVGVMFPPEKEEK